MDLEINVTKLRSSLLISTVGIGVIILLLKIWTVRFPISELLEKQYPKGYKIKSVKMGKHLVAFASDNSCNQHPVVYLLNKRNNFTYEITIEGVSCIWNSKFELVDVDGDGENEVISEWVGSNEGAGGLRGLVVWGLNQRKSLIPLVGYPENVKSEESRDLKIIVTKINASETISFPAISDDFYTDYRTSGSGLKLNYGSFIWNFDAGESRNSPHTWNLQRFELVENKFVKDSSWHNGEKYTPEEKLPTENVETKLKEIFNSL